MQKKSSRHHYIPQFLIKGFTNAENKVYVYDIEKDIVLTQPKSSKSIFFELDRNTIVKDDGTELSVIEDILYMKWDNDAARLVKKFQYDKLPNKSLLSDNNIADFLMFLIQLFWRIPYTDFAAQHLLDNAVIDSEDEMELKNSQPFQMHQRTLLYKETLKELTNIKRKKEGFFAKIFELDRDIFIIGDNPILFQKTPSTFDDLYDLDSMIAVSARRIFTNSLEELPSFGFNKALEYNSFIISQSKRFVCSGDKKLLEESVKYHKKIASDGFELELKNYLFDNK